jgi:hypothetical protein
MPERFFAAKQLQSCKLMITYSSANGKVDERLYRRGELFLRNHVHVCHAGKCGVIAAISEGGFEKCRLSYVCVSRTIDVLGSGCFANSPISHLAFEDPFRFATIEASAFAFVHRLRFFSFPVAVCAESITFPRESESESEVGGELSTTDDGGRPPGGAEIAALADKAERQNTGEQTCPSAGLADEVDVRAVPFDRIRLWTFASCRSLEEICIPSSVEVLCEKCFEFCSCLRIVRFESASKLVRIEGRAFSECGSLESMCIPSTVEILSACSFYSCRSLHLVRFESKSGLPDCQEFPSFGLRVDSRLREIAARVFALCDSLHSILIPSFVGAIDGSAFLRSGIRDVIVASDNCHFKV